MDGYLHRSQTATPDRHAALGPWNDLKRDWNRWSRSEQVAAECVVLTVLVVGSVLLGTLPLP